MNLWVVSSNLGVMKVGKWLRKQREELGFSQQEISEMSTVTRAKLSKIELGRIVQPREGTLRLLCEALYIPYEQLLAETTFPSADLGRKLRYLRQKMGITQRQLSKMCESSYSAIQKIEQGKYYPTPKTLQKILKTLGTSRREFRQLNLEE